MLRRIQLSDPGQMQMAGVISAMIAGLGSKTVTFPNTVTLKSKNV